MAALERLEYTVIGSRANVLSLTFRDVRIFVRNTGYFPDASNWAAPWACASFLLSYFVMKHPRKVKAGLRSSRVNSICSASSASPSVVLSSTSSGTITSLLATRALIVDMLISGALSITQKSY